MNYQVHLFGVNLWWNRNAPSLEGMLSRPQDCAEDGTPMWDKAGAQLSPGSSYYGCAFAQTYNDGRIWIPGQNIPAHISEIKSGWL